MAIRLIQNNFVSGELSPALYGRHDLKQYFQGAASIENFIVRDTGGLTKRPGTRFIDGAQGPEGTAYRLVTLLRTRKRYEMMLLYLKPGDKSMYYRIAGEGDRFGDELVADIAPVEDPDTLRGLKVKQIGDTLFFSRAGVRSFRAKFNYSTDPNTVEWSQLRDTVQVDHAPPFDGPPVVAGFNTDASQGFRPAKRSYALWGVKDGVFSEPTYIEANIWLYWVSGATVTLKFTPDFAHHDYYVLGVLQGASYGAVATFYPDNLYDSTGVAWSDTGAVKKTWTDPLGTTWTGTGGDDDIEDKLRTDDPNGKGPDGRSLSALLISGTFKVSSIDEKGCLSAISIWLGGVLENSVGAPVEFMNPAAVTVVADDSDGNNVGRWTVSGAYNDAPVVLYTEDVAEDTGKTYSITIEDASGSGRPVCVRKLSIHQDGAPREYIDDNISPGSITGQQDLMKTGDQGMDCSIIDSWEQRLVVASSKKKPFSLWFSRTGDIYNFYRNRPQVPSDAFDATIPATRASRILHILTARWMVLFTEAGEYLVDSAGGAGFSLNTITIKKSSGVGAHETIEPVATEDKILFAAADARSVYELRYDLSQDNVIPVDRSILSGHLTEAHKIVKIAYQRFPESVLWCLLDDGQLISMTYLPDQDVFAWSHHRFAESDGMRLVDVNIPGTTTEPPYGETMSDVLLTWESDNHPGSVYVEAMRNTVSTDSPPGEDARCVDHAGYQTDISVPVEARFVTMRPESPQLNTMALYKSVRDCTLRVRRSGLLEIRPYVDRAPTDPAQNGPLAYASSVWQKNKSPLVDGGVVHLVNGDVSILPRTISNGNGQIEVRSADEYPCEIQSILYNIDIATRPE